MPCNNYTTIKIAGWLWDFDRNNFKQIEYMLHLRYELLAKF